jgi:hypothetical protein
MVEISEYGFPLPTGTTQDDLKRHTDLLYTTIYLPSVCSDQRQVPTKLDRAKAIAAEVCARRFPVKRIPMDQQDE